MARIRMKSIVAAISLARQENGSYMESTSKLLGMAPVLARKLNTNLVFVNVYEPTQAPPWGEIPLPDKTLLSRADLDHALRIGKEYALHQYRNELEETVRQHAKQDIKAIVLEAKDSTQAIISEALRSESDLILTGTSRSSYKYIFKGFSTALSLMSAAPMPVLVVPEEAHIDWEQEGLRILVADDLRSDSEAVIRFAASLAVHLNRSFIEHVHVIESSPGMLGLKLTDDDVRHLCEQEMRRRSQDFVPTFKNKVEYNAQAIIGSVDTGIERMIEAHNPNLIVFGRHRAIKLRPLMIGRMSSRALLDLKRPVIVVPQEP